MKKVPISGSMGEGAYAKVDDADFANLSKSSWRLVSGYPARTSSTERMHRVIMRAKPGQMIDHVNGDKLDNRRCNLRFCTAQQNALNSARPVSSSSRYKGVSRVRPGGRWKVRIRISGKITHCGVYDTQEQAARAYNDLALKHYGEYARLNLVDH